MFVYCLSKVRQVLLSGRATSTMATNTSSALRAKFSTAVNGLQLSTSFRDLCDAGYPMVAIANHLYNGPDVLSLAQAAGKQYRSALLCHVKELSLYMPDEEDQSVTQSYRSLAQLLLKLDGLERVTFAPASEYLSGFPLLRLLPNLTSLTAMDAHGDRPLYPDACLKLVAALPGLRALDIASFYGDAVDYTQPRLDPHYHGEAGTEHLTQLHRLEHLDVTNNDWAGPSFHFVGELLTLRSLHMAYNRLDEEGAAALANLTNLTLLDCSNNQGRLGGTAGIAHLATLTGLASLNISSVRLGSAGAALLTAIVNLSCLDVHNNKLNAMAASHIGTLAQLTRLDLDNNRLGDEGAEHLTNLRQLEYLSISSNHLSTAGAAHICKLPALSHLNISKNALNAEAQMHFAKLTNLTYLDFNDNHIGCERFMQLSTLTQLHILQWRGNGWDKGNYARLRTVLPNLLDEGGA